MKKNWKQIAFTIFLAVSLWVIVTLSSTFYTSVYLPVRVHLADSTLAVSAVSHKFVIVGVQGEGWVLSGYYWGGNQYLDVYPEARKGNQIISTRDLIKKEKIFTSETNVINISPEMISVTIEKRAKKEVYVKPVLRLNFADKYDLVEPPRVEPIKIEISGPKSSVKRIDTVYTETVSLSGLKDSVTIEAKLKLPKYIKSKTKKVKISLNIQKIVDKQIRDVTVKIKGLPKDAELIIFPTKVAVNVRGGIEILGKLDKNDITAYVLYGEAIKDTTGAVKPHIILPKGVRELGVLPEKIEYVIKK